MVWDEEKCGFLEATSTAAAILGGGSHSTRVTAQMARLPNTTFAPVTAFRTCMKHQLEIPHPKKEPPCQGCSAPSGLGQTEHPIEAESSSIG